MNKKFTENDVYSAQSGLIISAARPFNFILIAK